MQDMDLDPELREAALKHLGSIKRRLESIARMLESESTYCVDILKKIRSAERALDGVGDVVLQSHYKHIVTAQSDDEVGRLAAKSWARLMPCLDADRSETSVTHKVERKFREPLPTIAE